MERLVLGRLPRPSLSYSIPGVRISGSHHPSVTSRWVSPAAQFYVWTMQLVAVTQLILLKGLAGRELHQSYLELVQLGIEEKVHRKTWQISRSRVYRDLNFELVLNYHAKKPTLSGLNLKNLTWFGYLQLACYFHSKYKASRSSTYTRNGMLLVPTFEFPI